MRRARFQRQRQAFGVREYASLQNSLRTLYTRMLTTNMPFITHTDFLNLCVDPEHHELCVRVGEIADVAQYDTPTHTILTDDLKLLVRYDLHRWDGQPSPIWPRKIQVLSPAAGEAYDKVMGWAKRQLEIKRDFGRASAVFEALNNKCTSAAQVRFYWPSVLALCSMNPATHDLGNQLQSLVTPRVVPALPMGLREACRTSSGTIAAAQLLSDNEGPWDGPVTLRLSFGAGSDTFVENGFKFKPY